jgi:hypothetical protein
MAKQTGFLSFTGTVGGITFYESKHGSLVRKKGGPDAAQIKKSPKFQRLRENGKEFGNCTKATRALRSLIRGMLKESSDFRVTSRLNKMMFAIKNLDTISKRGERSVAKGVLTPGADILLTGFDFNIDAPLKTVVKKTVSANLNSGVISIDKMSAKVDLTFPKGATHVRFSAAWLRLDFEGQTEKIEYNVVTRVISDLKQNVSLTPTAKPNGKGKDIFLLQVIFLQEVNGVKYELKNGEHNAMGIVG